MDHQTNRNTQIGNICIQWGNLEYHLATAIWMMCRLDVEVGKILTGGMDIKQRAFAAHAVAHQTNAPVPLKRALKVVLDELRGGLIDRRNQAVHGVHFATAQPDAIEVELHRGKGGRGRRLQPDIFLKELGDDIHRVTHAFDEALAEYGKKLLGEHAIASDGLKALNAILAATKPERTEG